MSIHNPFELYQSVKLLTYWIDVLIFSVAPNETKSAQTFHYIERILWVKNYNLHWRWQNSSRFSLLVMEFIIFHCEAIIFRLIFEKYFWVFVTYKRRRAFLLNLLVEEKFEWKLFCTWTIAVQLFVFQEQFKAWASCVFCSKFLRKHFALQQKIVCRSCLFYCSCFRQSSWDFRLLFSSLFFCSILPRILLNFFLSRTRKSFSL